MKSFALAAGVAAGAWSAAHRRSDVVQSWEAPRFPTRRVGPLAVRVGGDGERVVLLLHGLMATGDIFGAPYERHAETHRLVVPDLLGFGRSLSEDRIRFAPDDHLAALDELVEVVGGDRPVLLGAHSMGAALALRWAARRSERVTGVVCWGAPLYTDAAAAKAAIDRFGGLARLLAIDTRWARSFCSLNCRHRSTAGWIATAVRPGLPSQLARNASLHTWEAYHQSMAGLVIETDWADLTAQLTRAGVPISFAWGDLDPIGDPPSARSLGAAQVQVVPGAGHHLPITHSRTCLAQLDSFR